MIINEENYWDQDVEGHLVERSVDCVWREEVVQTFNEMKRGKVLGRSEVSLELIAVSGGVEIQVMAEICLRVLDGFGMPLDWTYNSVSNLQWEG